MHFPVGTEVSTTDERHSTPWPTQSWWERCSLQAFAVFLDVWYFSNLHLCFTYLGAVQWLLCHWISDSQYNARMSSGFSFPSSFPIPGSFPNLQAEFGVWFQSFWFVLSSLLPRTWKSSKQIHPSIWHLFLTWFRQGPSQETEFWSLLSHGQSSPPSKDPVSAPIPAQRDPAVSSWKPVPIRYHCWDCCTVHWPLPIWTALFYHFGHLLAGAAALTGRAQLILYSSCSIL